MLTLVLLPGMDGSGCFFEPIVNALGDSVITKIVSYPYDKPLNYAELAKIVKSSLPKKSPYVLLGESFSGPIAISLAAENPTGLQAVILVCTFVTSPIPMPSFLRTLASQFPVHLIPKAVVLWFLPGIYSGNELEARLQNVLAKVSKDVWRERLLAVLKADFKKQLSEIKVPVLYIRATQDKIVPKSASELISLHQPNMVIADIVGPHIVLQTHPEASAAVILRFLGGTLVCNKIL